MLLNINWMRVMALTIVIVGLLAIAGYAWYYVTVSRMIQESMESRRQVEAVEAAMWKKYCTTLPYPNEVVKRFCTRPPVVQ
jgi:endoglucanase Acf2